MNLAEIKGLVLEAGINNLDENALRAFINSGQRLLDRVSDFPHQQGKLSFTLASGVYFLVFPSRLRIVHGVWRRDAETGVDPERLEKVDLIELRGLYPLPSDSTFWGTPLYYAHTTSILASFGSPTIAELTMPVDSVPLATDDPYDYKGIMVGPTSDGVYYVDILGTAYSKELVADTDASFWSKHHPEILMNAVMFKIEGFLRSSSSAQSYFQALMNDIRYLNYDYVEDELQEKPNYMGY